MLGIFGLQACSSYAPIQTASQVDIHRFMGPWYVIASIPTFLEKGAHNAVESYELEDNGTIKTTFTFLDGSFDGKEKTYHPTGFVVDKQSNAVWRMQFLWPFKADYRIVYVSPDYNQTVIGRLKRDYVWIMARTPHISDAEYDKLLSIVKARGYDPTKVERVPQRWP